jgi:hypothetical protein
MDLKKTSERLYDLPVAGHRKSDIARSEFSLKVKLTYEILDKELRADPTIMIRLSEAVELRQLPPSYYSHVVVQDHPDELVFPLAIYLDGVAYSMTDTVLGVWVINLITGRRHLIAIVRKRLICKCGCAGGWCTIYPLLVCLHWQFVHLAMKRLPCARHDGDELDPARRNVAGMEMQVRAILLWLKGDWAEHCERFGYPTNASGLRPCFCCAGSGPDLYLVAGISLLSLPWYENTDDDYEDACKRCEHSVVVSRQAHEDLRGLLVYDKRKDGSHGRALNANYGALELLAGDRLEPTPTLMDVGAGFDRISQFPCPVQFWRPSANTICHHRCPLFDKSIGITPTDTIRLDLLHALFLGPMHSWCKLAMWMVLMCGAWGSIETTAVELLTIAVLSMRAELMRWYKVRHQLFPSEVLTRVSDLTVKMVGAKDDRKLKTKAMETYGLMFFLTDMLEKYKVQIGSKAAPMREAGQMLARYVEIVKEGDMNLTPSALQECNC